MIPPGLKKNPSIYPQKAVNQIRTIPDTGIGEFCHSGSVLLSGMLHGSGESILSLGGITTMVELGTSEIELRQA